MLPVKRKTFTATLVDVSPHVHGRNVYGRIAHGAKCLVKGETSMGRNDHEAKCPYMGRNVHGAICQWGEKSINPYSRPKIVFEGFDPINRKQYQRRPVRHLILRKYIMFEAWYLTDLKQNGDVTAAVLNFTGMHVRYGIDYRMTSCVILGYLDIYGIAALPTC